MVPEAAVLVPGLRALQAAAHTPAVVLLLAGGAAHKVKGVGDIALLTPGVGPVGGEVAVAVGVIAVALDGHREGSALRVLQPLGVEGQGHLKHPVNVVNLPVGLGDFQIMYNIIKLARILYVLVLRVVHADKAVLPVLVLGGVAAGDLRHLDAEFLLVHLLGQLVGHQEAVPLAAGGAFLSGLAARAGIAGAQRQRQRRGEDGGGHPAAKP